MKRKHSGFTVLELLVVIGMMTILMGLVLVGLTSARKHSHDENRISDLKTIIVGLEQYHDICRQYPAALDGAQTCGALGGKSLNDFITTIDQYTPSHGYSYVGLASDYQDLASCTGFHIGVTLESPSEALSAGKSGAVPATNTCLNQGQMQSDTIDGSLPSVFDIMK